MNLHNGRISANDDVFKVSRSEIAGVIGEMEKVIIGKRGVIEQLMMALLSGGHVLIEDIPGVGKTTLASALSKILGLKYKRAQFTPDLMPSDITGFTVYNKANGEFEYKEGLALANILLADEINRTSPKTQSSLLEVMEEGSLTVDGKTYIVPSPFMVIATQNPMGFVGTHPLPEAQLDRFIIKLTLGYPSLYDEVGIISARRTENPLDSLSAAFSKESLLRAQEITKNIYVDESLYVYIVELTARTRTEPLVALGASPRASLALMKLAQAHAFLNSRDFVIPEDIQAMFIPAISHRIMLKQEARLNKISAGDILGQIMKAVAPRKK